MTHTTTDLIAGLEVNARGLSQAAKESLAELRTAAAEMQAAQLEILRELATLRLQLRAAEIECDEMRFARDRAEKARAEDYRHQIETVRALMEQRDAARADAEWLAKAINTIEKRVETSNVGISYPGMYLMRHLTDMLLRYWWWWLIVFSVGFVMGYWLTQIGWKVF